MNLIYNPEVTYTDQDKLDIEQLAQTIHYRFFRSIYINRQYVWNEAVKEAIGAFVIDTINGFNNSNLRDVEFQMNVHFRVYVNSLSKSNITIELHQPFDKKTQVIFEEVT